MKDTFDYKEDVAELAISVTNELARCACSHCVDIYIRGEEEHFCQRLRLTKLRLKVPVIILKMDMSK